VRYVAEPYFGISHLHDNAAGARFTTLLKNKKDARIRQFAFSLSKGLEILGPIPV